MNQPTYTLEEWDIIEHALDRYLNTLDEPCDLFSKKFNETWCAKEKYRVQAILDKLYAEQENDNE